VSAATGSSVLLADARAGDQRAIARLLSTVERSLADAAELMELVDGLPRTGRAIGLIGPPGAGKSSLVASVVEALIAQEKSVAVLANDPTGAHSGGALLGDRVRMKSLSRDPRVFIRSVAARDPLRSLNATTFGAVALLTRLGFDYVLVEAVGAGQSDIGTSLVADTTVLVLVPGLGDDVQAIKSGVIEVADVVVVNKSDLPDAKRAAQTMRQALKMLHAGEEWVPPVVQTSAVDATGIDELLRAVDKHREAGARATHADGSYLVEVLVDLVTFEVTRRLRAGLPGDRFVAEQLESVRGRDAGIVGAALAVVEAVLARP
jgi:LAO/AO transport system kinase